MHGYYHALVDVVNQSGCGLQISATQVEDKATVKVSRKATWEYDKKRQNGKFCIFGLDHPHC